MATCRRPVRPTSSRDELADALCTHDLVMEVQLVFLELEDGPVVDLQLADDGRVAREVHDEIDQSATRAP